MSWASVHHGSKEHDQYEGNERHVNQKGTTEDPVSTDDTVIGIESISRTTARTKK